MRDYGKVHTSFWTSANIRAMSEDGRALAMYLLTCPHGTIAGVFRLPDGYACEDLQWDSERVNKGFVELLENGFANRCETTKWVWVAKHFEWNQPENPNQKKAATKVANQIPDLCAWKPVFMQEYAEFLGIKYEKKETVNEPLRNGLLTSNSKQEQEQEQKTFRTTNGTNGEIIPVAAAPEPEKPDTVFQEQCRSVWSAYAGSYADRYGTNPVRNAKVNSNVKAFVQRVGAEEAPQIAAWFVSHPGGFYTGRMHDFGCLLSDAEKLRTEWATGRVMTQGKARQSDRTGTTGAALAEVLAELGDAA